MKIHREIGRDRVGEKEKNKHEFKKKWSFGFSCALRLDYYYYGSVFRHEGHRNNSSTFISAFHILMLVIISCIANLKKKNSVLDENPFRT